MTKMYCMLSLVILLIQIQTIFGAMNITIGDIENNKLPTTNNNNNNGNTESFTITGYVCPANGECVARGDPDYIIPKSSGKEKIDNVFTDITTLDGFENNKKGLIVEACNKRTVKDGKCQTRKCAVNEDCLSGLCENSICMINPKNRLSECEDVNGIFVCSKYLQESCTLSSECAGRCKNFVCTYRHLNALNTSSLLYYSSFIGTAICLILLFCCCLCCPGIFSWDVKKVRNNNNPPVVV